MEPKREKVIIIGGGPSGLAAGVYNARAFLNPLVIAGSPPGGQLMLTTDVENWPGIKAIQGPELVRNLRDHAEHFGTRFIDDNVAEVNFDDPDNLWMKLSNGDEYHADAVLIATGASARWLGLEAEDRLRGKGVSACATCDGFFFKDKVVAVVGGGDTAMEEAMVMTKFASKVYLMHRRDEFRASQIMRKRVEENEKIEILWGTEVEDVLGENVVEGVKVKFTTETSKNNENIKDGVLAIQGLFIAIGHVPNTKFLRDSNNAVAMRPNGYLLTSSMVAWEDKRNKDHGFSLDGYDFQYRHATNKTGVFAAGDVVDFIYRQGVTAAGLGVEGALEVERYLEAKEG